jgi:hypothetical protein
MTAARGPREIAGVAGTPLGGHVMAPWGPGGARSVSALTRYGARRTGSLARPGTARGRRRQRGDRPRRGAPGRPPPPRRRLRRLAPPPPAGWRRGAGAPELGRLAAPAPNRPRREAAGPSGVAVGAARADCRREGTTRAPGADWPHPAQTAATGGPRGQGDGSWRRSRQLPDGGHHAGAGGRLAAPGPNGRAEAEPTSPLRSRPATSGAASRTTGTPSAPPAAIGRAAVPWLPLPPLAAVSPGAAPRRRSGPGSR